ncbi:HD domain-containing protein [Saccharopolyspora cebuensis]|uniref:HD domain-containing protein n=1 Tax=Saccharopolyspora cebuensis TaxID=418759 RepID=A0ABV4CHJ6_9PSEU
MTLYRWAFDVAEQKLSESLPRRWSHVQGVAERARSLRAVSGADADLLEAAAILHDVGYAPDLATTAFHPLDGAVFLRQIGAPDRLVHLVAHHSYAELEAGLRGLSAELAEFTDERGPLRDALWYCDLNTTPDGEEVDARERIAEIKQRYGPGHLVTTFITEASPELLAAVDRTRERAQVAQLR